MQGRNIEGKGRDLGGVGAKGTRICKEVADHASKQTYWMCSRPLI